jgi:hypothetical protein
LLLYIPPLSLFPRELLVPLVLLPSELIDRSAIALSIFDQPGQLVLRRCELELGGFEGRFREVELGGEAAVGEGELGQGGGLGRNGGRRGVRSGEAISATHYYCDFLF